MSEWVSEWEERTELLMCLDLVDVERREDNVFVLNKTSFSTSIFSTTSVTNLPSLCLTSLSTVFSRMKSVRQREWEGGGGGLMFAVHFLLFFFLCLVLVLEEEDDCGVSSTFVLVQSLRRNYGTIRRLARSCTSSRSTSGYLQYEYFGSVESFHDQWPTL